MMSGSKSCGALPERISLSCGSTVISRKFIKEKQQLESVLGPSNANWFEDASKRKIQQDAMVRSFDSIVDSPLPTPRISQICMDELRVGSTPDGSNCSPKTVDSLLNSLPIGSTPDMLLKPVLGNSPCPLSPIGLNLGRSQSDFTLAQSLGANVDESVFNWTSSLATPPTNISLNTEKTPVDSGKIKDLARALFSPNDKFDTSVDSVQPLDSTCEDEPCDLIDENCFANQNTERMESSVLSADCGHNINKTTTNKPTTEISDTVRVEQTSVSPRKTGPVGSFCKNETQAAVNCKSVSPTSKGYNSTIQRYFEVTSSDTLKISPKTSSGKELQVVSPLQNLVNTDFRQAVNTSLNESVDLKDSVSNTCGSIKTETKSAMACNDSHVSFSVNGRVSSPLVSSNQAVGVAGLVMSPTFTQRSSRKSNTIPESTPVASPRYSVVTALSDFFDSPSSSAGRRKKAPKKRKSIELDTLEFVSSDVDGKCLTEGNITLHSILSSKKKERKSNKKVRFSDEISTPKVTFSLGSKEIQVDLNDSNGVNSNRRASIVRTAEEEMSDVKCSNGLRTDKTEDQDIKEHERVSKRSKTATDEHLHFHQVQSIPSSSSLCENINSKTKQIDTTLKTKSGDSISYCKRRALKMRLKAERNDNKSDSNLSDCKVDKRVEASMNPDGSKLIGTINESKTCINNRTEDSEAFSQVSPSALTEMCNIAHGPCVGSSLKVRLGDKSVRSDVIDPYTKSDLKTQKQVLSSLQNKHEITENSIVPKKMEYEDLYKNNQSFDSIRAVAAPRAFFYPSSKQIAMSCPKKVFEYEDKGIGGSSGLVKSVTSSDLIQAPERKSEDRKLNLEADSSGHTHIKTAESDIFLCDAVKSTAGTGFVQLAAQSGGVTKQSLALRSKQDIRGPDAVQEAQMLMIEKNELIKHHVKSESEKVDFGGFMFASGSSVKIKEDALKKAEKLICEDLSEMCNNQMKGTKGIKVTSQSMQKAQNLVSNITISPKENRLSQSMMTTGLHQDKEHKQNDSNTLPENECGIDFSEWFEEMEQSANNLVEEVTDGLESSCIDKTRLINEISGPSKQKEIRVSIDGMEPSVKNKLKEDSDSVSETYSISKYSENEKDTLITSKKNFSTGDGVRTESGESEAQNAEKLMLDVINNDPIIPFAKSDVNQDRLNFDHVTSIAVKLDYQEHLETDIPGSRMSDNNSGFKTASGKTLSVTGASLKKASYLIENGLKDDLGYSTDNIRKKTRSDLIENNEKSDNHVARKHSKMNPSLAHDFTKELSSLKTCSLDEELKALTSLKTKKQMFSRESTINNEVIDTLEGFRSASGKKCEISEASMKEAENLVCSDSGNSEFHLTYEKGSRQTSNKKLQKKFESENSLQALNGQSVEQELESLIAIRSTILKPANVAIDKTKITPTVNPYGNKKKCIFPPGANVPKGFRPFKAPRLIKPQVLANTLDNQENADRDEKQNNSISQKIDKCLQPSHECNESDKSAFSHLKKENKANVHGDTGSPVQSKFGKDMKSEHNRNIHTEQYETLVNEQEVDFQDCCSGILSQMFADEMEPFVICNGKNSIHINDLVPSGMQDDSIKAKHIYRFNERHTEFSEGEASSTDKNHSGEQGDNILRSKGFILPVTDANTCTTFEINKPESSFRFATASGKKVNVNTDSLSKASNLLNACNKPCIKGSANHSFDKEVSDSESALQENNHFSDIIQLPKHHTENICSKQSTSETVKKIPLVTQIGSKINFDKDESIVPKIEINIVPLENKVQKDCGASDADPVFSFNLCMFKTASGKQLAVSEELLNIENRKFDINHYDKFFQNNTGLKQNYSDGSGNPLSESYDSNRESIHNTKISKIDTEYIPEDEIGTKFMQSNIKTIQGIITVNNQGDITKEIADSEKKFQKYDKGWSQHGLFQTACGKDGSITEESASKVRKKLVKNNKITASSVSEYETTIQATDRFFNSAEVLMSAVENLKENETLQTVPELDQFEVAVDFRKISIPSSSSVQIAGGTPQASDSFKDSVQKLNNVKVESYPLQTANDENASVSKKALQITKNTMKEPHLSGSEKGGLFKTVLNGFSPFQTASGKTVTVSEKALEVARKSLNECAVELDRTEHLNISLEMTSLKNMMMSEEDHIVMTDHLKQTNPKCYTHLFENEYTLQSVNAEKMNSSLAASVYSLKDRDKDVHKEKPVGGSFSKIPADYSVVEGRNILEDTEDTLKYSDASCFTQKLSNRSLFQTASGKTVTVSEKALKAARDSFTNNDSDCNLPMGLFHLPVETSNEYNVMMSGTAFQVKEKDRLKNTKVKESDSYVFQTANGKNVTLSEKALKIAKDSFDISVGESNTLKTESDNILFQTASGKIEDIPQNELEIVKNTMKPKDFKLQMSPGDPFFQTAGGRNVTVSENSVKEVKNSFRELAHDFSMPKFSSNSLFQTASGKNVTITEKALLMAREALESSEEKSFNKGNGNYSHLDDIFERQQCGSIQVNSRSLFQTASGKNVEISENALGTARNMLDSFDDKKSPKIVLGTTNTSLEERDGSENRGKRSLSRSLEVLSTMKKNLFELKKSEHSKIKRWNSESECDDIRIPSKRQRLDDGADVEFNKQEEQTNRVPVRSGPEGLLTDRRFAVSRGFKPVRSQTLFKPPARSVLNDLTSGGNTTGAKKGTPTKSSFQTPYKTTSAITPSLPVKVTVHAPVFVSKTKPSTVVKDKCGVHHPDSVFAHNDVYPTTAMQSPQKGVIGKNLFYSCSEALQNKAKTEALGGANKTEAITYDRIAGSKTADSNSGDKTCDPRNADIVDDSEEIFKKEVVILEQDKSCYNEKRENLSKTDKNLTAVNNNSGSKEKLTSSNIVKDGGKLAEEAAAKVDEHLLAEHSMTGEENSSYDRMDVDMNDEAAIFYCNLIEARRHQEGIIKQKEKVKIQPHLGRLYRFKQVQGRWKLRDFVRMLKQDRRETDFPLRTGSITSANASEYKFNLEDFYGGHVSHVLVGDGAYLVPDDAGCVGKQEFYSAFLTMDAVDPKLISDVWVCNHYRWIVWKLASYEAISPSCSSGRYLTPEMVMLQLKYRYDREVDLCQRSALKKIFERDDAPGKRMVLCVSAIIKCSQTSEMGEQENPTVEDLDIKVLLEVTDGWYSIKAQIDFPLTDLVRQGKITVGQKICVSGAELIGGDDACSPLEAPGSIMLKISCNSCRPAPWDSVLGYQLDPRPLCVPLIGLRGEGGTVGVMDLIIVRKYPIMYMEKLPGGGCMFRTGKAEEKMQQTFQSKQQGNMEKLYRQIEEVMEREEKQEKQSVSKKKWSRAEVEYLQTGREIHEALSSSRQPDMIESFLTEKQISKLMEYKGQLHDEKLQELNSRFQKAWQDRDEGVSERNVTPVLKFRVAGCAHRDMDNKTSTILTVWRPAPEICELAEGKRYKVYSLTTSTARSKYIGHGVQLTATKQTKFQLMNVDENFLDNIYEPREVLWVSDISRRQPPYGEVDFVGIVIQVAQPSLEESFSRQPDTVFCADCKGNLLAIKFWHGIKAYDDGLLKAGNIICCSNLMDKSPYRSKQLPSLEASNEFTHITNKPQNSEQSQAVSRLNTALKDKKAFLEKANLLLAEIQENRQISRTTPEKRRSSSVLHFGNEDTPTKTKSGTSIGQKSVPMETKDDINLSLTMSVDSSFEEEICKADLDNICVGQNTDVSGTKICSDIYTERFRSPKVSHQMENSGDFHNQASVMSVSEKNETQAKLLELNVDILDANLSVHSDIGLKHTNTVKSQRNRENERVKQVSDRDQNNDILSVKCTKTISEIMNQGPSSHTPETSKDSVRLNPKAAETPSEVPKTFDTQTFQKLKLDKESVPLHAKSLQTPSKQAILVRSPEDESTMGLSPQTPSSQQSRAVYQEKISKLLSYGSPSALTPLRTPLSRSVSKGFKPPSFVKK